MSNPRPEGKKQQVLINHNQPHAKEIVECFTLLEKNRMLTKKNLIAVTQNPENAKIVTSALQYLELQNLNTLENVSAVVHAGIHAKSLARAYVSLTSVGIIPSKEERDELNKAGEEMPAAVGKIMTSHHQLSEEISAELQQSEEILQLSKKIAMDPHESEKITLKLKELDKANQLTGDNITKVVLAGKRASFFSHDATSKSNNDAGIAPEVQVEKQVKPRK